MIFSNIPSFLKDGNHNGCFIAIDFGLSRIGYAYSDVNKKIAFSGDIIKNTGNEHDLIFEVLEKHKSNSLIFGMPVSLDRSSFHPIQTNIMEIAEKLDRFAMIHINAEINIGFIDESFSTAAALTEVNFFCKQQTKHITNRSSFKNAKNVKNISKNLLKKGDDHLAARQILCSVLDYYY